MSIRAVVVDDEKETLDLFCDLLVSHEIKIAGKGYSGKEAVFLYQKLKPDVVFLDVSMPVYDGIYALEQIREINPNAVVFMIADKLKLNAEMKMGKLNPSAVFSEPIDVNEIIRKTCQLCAPSKDELENMNKTMITLALKNTLLELDGNSFDKVTEVLQKDYKMTLDDCFDNPDELKQVLSDLFGESYGSILKSLKENLKTISTQQSTKNFIHDLRSD